MLWTDCALALVGKIRRLHSRHHLQSRSCLPYGAVFDWNEYLLLLNSFLLDKVFLDSEQLSKQELVFVIDIFPPLLLLEVGERAIALP